MKDWLRVPPLTGLLIFGAALFGAILHYGFPPSDGWLKFIGAMIFFAGITYAVVLADRSARKE